MIISSNFFSSDDGLKLHFLKQEGRSACNESGEATESNTGGNEKSSKPVLVFLPGLFQSARLFLSQMSALSSTHRLIAFDPRGHGESDKPEQGKYDVLRLAQDLFQLLDHLQLDCVDVMAHGASCAVVMAFVGRFGPDRLRSIIFVDHMICFLKQPQWTEDESHNYGAILTPEQGQAFLSLLTSPDAAETESAWQNICSDQRTQEGLKKLVLDSRTLPGRAAAQLAESILNFDPRDILPLITVPTLCVGAQNSYIPGECLAWMASQMPNATDTILPGTHYLCTDEPGPLNVVVYDFLQSQSSTGKYKQA